MNQEQLASQWSNYCLKTTEITFTNPPNGGSPILNGNSVTERINAGVPIEQASCITCHAYASFLSNGTPNTQGLKNNLIGAVNSSLLANSQQSDFMWGILGAPAGGSRARIK
jgi:hypothetical protein